MGALDAAKVQLADKVGDFHTATNPVPVAIQMGNTQVTTGNPLAVSDVSTNKFFTNQTAASTALMPQLAFGFTSRHVKIINDGTNAINFSFDGTNIHGIAKQNEILQFDGMAQTQAYISAITTTGGTYRVWAW